MTRKTGKNRAKSRAVRAAMADTGVNYTRAAAKVSGRNGLSGAIFRTDAVREHVIALLKAYGRTDDARGEYLDQLEAKGRRIVSGGQTGQDTWEITDWNTGEVIAEGDGGLAGYEEAAARLDPDDRWFHIDHVSDAVPHEEAVITPGVPASLSCALDDWLGQMSTPDEEIAEFVGWPVEKVKQYR